MSRSILTLGLGRSSILQAKNRLTVATVLVLLAAISISAAGDRIVAIGDVHGDYTALVALLQQGKLIDNKLNWSGKRTTLIFTGDLLDRGPDSRKVLDLLMKLEGQANRKRGHLIVLLGNHEIMNIVGDLRYVSREEYASFADEASEERRAKGFETYRNFLDSKAEGTEVGRQWMEAHPEGFLEHREAYGPKGKYGRWLRRRAVVAEEDGMVFVHGGIGSYLADLTLPQINERVWAELEAFDSIRQYLVDRGIILPFFTFEEMTRAARDELDQKKLAAEQEGAVYTPSEEEEAHRKNLETFLDYPGWLSFHPRGPVWFRGYFHWSDEEGEEKIQVVLNGLGARHIIVGHTSQADGRIHQRFDMRVVFIDTGMLTSHYTGGHPSMLEISDEEWSAVYLDGTGEVLPVSVDATTEPQPSPDTPAEDEEGTATNVGATASLPSIGTTVWFDPNGNRLPFTRDEQLLEYLATAKVLNARTIEEGVTHPKKLLLERDGIQMHAIFRDVDRTEQFATFRSGKSEGKFRDAYQFEKAAYELSKLLGLDSVPPVVIRKFRGISGSFQVWIEGAMTEGERVERNLPPPQPDRWAHQIATLALFDELVQNTDRNSGNLLIDRNWKIWFIDHTRAFRQLYELKNPDRLHQCERSLWEKLRALDKPTLKRRLGAYLEVREIKALLKRRDAIVTHFLARIEAEGEGVVLYTAGEVMGTTADGILGPDPGV